LRSRDATAFTLEKHLYEIEVRQHDFCGDTAYLLKDSTGRDYILDPGRPDEDARAIAVFSTEELLLNLYRLSACFGQDLVFQIDASYRYTTERKLGYIPISVASLTQTGRHAAYVIMTKEDSAAHTFIIDAVKTALEAVVNRRIARGDKYV
jgi:hypothetical protein